MGCAAINSSEASCVFSCPACLSAGYFHLGGACCSARLVQPGETVLLHASESCLLWICAAVGSSAGRALCGSPFPEKSCARFAFECREEIKGRQIAASCEQKFQDLAILFLELVISFLSASSCLIVDGPLKPTKALFFLCCFLPSFSRKDWCLDRTV